MEALLGIVGSIAGAVSALAACYAITQAKSIVFLPYKNELALTLRDLKCYIETEHHSFKVSDHLDAQRKILQAKYTTSLNQYNDLENFLMACHKMESLIRRKEYLAGKKNIDNTALEETESSISKAYDQVFENIKKVQCDIRLG